MGNPIDNALLVLPWARYDRDPAGLDIPLLLTVNAAEDLRRGQQPAVGRGSGLSPAGAPAARRRRSASLRDQEPARVPPQDPRHRRARHRQLAGPDDVDVAFRHAPPPEATDGPACADPDVGTPAVCSPHTVATLDGLPECFTVNDCPAPYGCHATGDDDGSKRCGCASDSQCPLRPDLRAGQQALRRQSQEPGRGPRRHRRRQQRLRRLGLHLLRGRPRGRPRDGIPRQCHAARRGPDPAGAQLPHLDRLPVGRQRALAGRRQADLPAELGARRSRWPSPSPAPRSRSTSTATSTPGSAARRPASTARPRRRRRPRRAVHSAPWSPPRPCSRRTPQPGRSSAAWTWPVPTSAIPPGSQRVTFGPLDRTTCAQANTTCEIPLSPGRTDGRRPRVRDPRRAAGRLAGPLDDAARPRSSTRPPPA